MSGIPQPKNFPDYSELEYSEGNMTDMSELSSENENEIND